jgi:spermidine synthase
MIPPETLDTAPIPGGGELRLVRRGDEYLILLGANSLMSSRRSGSEEALASLACARLAGRPRPRLLVGGLGMGFTLRKALALLPRDAELVVAELVPAVIAWARGPMAHLHGDSLDDPRVKIVVQDVARPIAAEPRGWDAILLDVDNGPEGLTIAANDGLYSADGLAAARRALRPGGILAVWSAHPDPGFVARLRRAGLTVEENVVRSGPGGSKGARHLIWLAAVPGRARS